MIKYYFLFATIYSLQAYSSTAVFTQNKNKTSSSSSQRVYSDSVQRQIIPPPNPGQAVYSNSSSSQRSTKRTVKYITVPATSTTNSSAAQSTVTTNSSASSTPASSSFVTGPCVTVGPGGGCGPAPLTYSWEMKFCAMHGCTPYSLQNIIDIDRSCSASNAGQVIRFIQTTAANTTQEYIAVCFASTSTDFLTQVAQTPSETIQVGPKKEYYFATAPHTQAEREQYGVIITTGPSGSCTAQNLGATEFVPSGNGNTLSRTYTCVLKGSAEESAILAGSGSSSSSGTSSGGATSQCATGEFTNSSGQVVLWKCKCNDDTTGWFDQGDQCFHKVK